MAKKVEQKIESLDQDRKCESVNLQNTYAYGCQISTSNSSGFSATLSLEVSNDLKNWVTVDNSSTTLTGDDTQLFDVTQSSVAAVRVSFGSVTGSADVIINYMLK